MDKLPREKIIEDGVSTLSDSELLAVMLGTGSNHESVFQMSERLILSYGFSKLCTMSYQELSKIEGIKEAKATKLMAVFEIVKRVSEEKNHEKRLLCSKDIFEYVKEDYFLARKEILTVLYLDSSLRVMKKEKYTDDDYTQIQVPVKTIIKNAIDNDCYGVFLIHNHPAGNPSPSEADRKYTFDLEYSLKTCNIYLLDHLILSGDSYFSFSDEMAKKNGFL